MPTNGPLCYGSRAFYCITKYKDKIWLIGGMDGAPWVYKDVWYTDNCTTWVEAVSDAASNFPARCKHATVVLGDRMYIIAGTDENTIYSDVWWTENGSDWYSNTSNAPFGKRAKHAATIFDSSIIVIGGDTPNGPENDVWQSFNGVGWNELTPDAGFELPTLAGHSCISYDNKIWIIGGSTTGLDGAATPSDDIYYSSDGKNWIKATSNPGFSSRFYQASVEFDGKIWAIGGKNATYNDYIDAWYWQR
jgi:hypothetical protein